MRKRIPKELALQVEFASDRICCVCHEPNKAVQLAHIDDDPSNNDFDNLALLCLDCHSQAHTRGGFGRNLTADLVRKYNADWRKQISENSTRSKGKLYVSGTPDPGEQSADFAGSPDEPFSPGLLLSGHGAAVQQISWSPDGYRLASASEDHMVRVWNTETGKCLFTVKHTDKVLCIAWSPDGRTLASAALDKTIRLWDAANGRANRTIPGFFNTVWNITWSQDSQRLAAGTDASTHIYEARSGKLQMTIGEAFEAATNVAWSPDGRMLAASFLSGGVRLFDAKSDRPIRQLVGHADAITCLAWSPTSEMLVAGSSNSVVQMWDIQTGWQTGVLEGMTSEITCVAFSPDGQFLAALSFGGSIHVWHCETREIVALHENTQGYGWARVLAFSPGSSRLATPGDQPAQVCLWDLNSQELVRIAEGGTGIHYANAKVALLGNSGVGKSGLALVLSHQPFAATESSHARHVLQLDRQNVAVDAHRNIVQETLLWDMAGQPGYRLIHQLHLNEAAIALVVFDASDETDPFAGVDHWNRALQQAQRLQGDAAPPLKKFLVAARTDRGTIDASRERIDAFVRQNGFDGYFKTSAKDGYGIAELVKAIQASINWQAQPRVSSTELFQRIRDFFVQEKRKGRILSKIDDLFRSFIANYADANNLETTAAQFRTCLGLAEARGLLRRLHFGDLVLLQPEYLDVYASALVEAAKDEPSGAGSILQEDAQAGRFNLSADERLKNRGEEELLLIAVVEDLLRHEIALRETLKCWRFPCLSFPADTGTSRPAGAARKVSGVQIRRRCDQHLRHADSQVNAQRAVL